MKEILGVKLYTLAEVGILLGIQRATISKYVQQGRLKARTIGGHKYVCEDDIKELLTTPDDKQRLKI
jgi:excisionase family DNA binding protein